MAGKHKLRAFSTNPKDYGEFISLYEAESLAAEAVLANQKAAMKKNKKRKGANKPVKEKSASGPGTACL